MPYRVVHKPVASGKDWAIQKHVSGTKWRIVGRSREKMTAEASIRARQMSGR